MEYRTLVWDEGTLAFEYRTLVWDEGTLARERSRGATSRATVSTAILNTCLAHVVPRDQTHYRHRYSSLKMVYISLTTTLALERCVNLMLKNIYHQWCDICKKTIT